MGRPARPVLTIRHNGSRRSFSAGHDVVIGRDLRADVRIADPRISRRHLILRFDEDRWVAIDNGSVNGTYLNGYRMPVIDIHDGQCINVGNPEGPRLTFDIAQRDRQDTGAPATMWWSPDPPGAQPPSPRQDNPGPEPNVVASAKRQDAAPPSRPVLDLLAGPRPEAAPAPEPSSPSDAAPAPPADMSNLATRMVKLLTPRSPQGENHSATITVGRSEDNDIVVPDVLASRHHATLVPTPLGTEIRDSSSNGTFVNGTRIGSAILAEDDVITIGNVDLVFRDGTLLTRVESDTCTGGLEVRGVSYVVDNGKQLLDDISLTARPGTLTAVIGGSGAGKSTLARLIAGYTSPSSGAVTFAGHDIHAEYASLRSRIGMVPQDDVVHRQLTVNQALGYAAELRLPPDTSKADRATVVAQVLDELDLTTHADTRVDKLSGGQRKRASVALELLTGPALLILDEPTSGLDPALDHQVMTMLRQLADAGRVVIVVTHMLSYLDICDQLLLVAPGGKTAYCGPPDQIGQAMGTTNWATIFTAVGADPDEANRRYRARRPADKQSPAAPDKPADLGAPVQTSVRRQLSTIARRQVRLVVADRGYFVFLALLPFILGALSLTVPGTQGFHVAGPASRVPDESGQVLTLLTIAAVFMGTALTIRDLVGERAIFQRERAVGLSTTAYLFAKAGVFCGFATAQSAIATIIVILGKSAPTRGAVFLGHSSVAAGVELFITVAAACVASAILGLAISALARSGEQIMPLFVVSIMTQLVLAGGLVPVTGRPGLDQLSMAAPARWGYAAAASTVDLRHLVPRTVLSQDRFWRHTPGTWLFDMAMLAALALACAAVVRWKIRLRR